MTERNNKMRTSRKANGFSRVEVWLGSSDLLRLDLLASAQNKTRAQVIAKALADATFQAAQTIRRK